MTHFLVPQELMEKTVNYLAAKPYAEVYELIQELLKCPAVTSERSQGSADQEEQADADAG